ncbi:MAG TPA: alpha-amylase family glycosyl hydrolase, partial [Bacteroidales bacterium]|nr:alpha-amylase family glycosyl hydrolase [Bacteroidales bacterium]
MKKIVLILTCFLGIAVAVAGQDITLQRVEPPFWWKGFKNPNLQVMVHGTGIGKTTVSIRYPGVELVKVHKVDNPNYLFLDLKILPAARPGNFAINFVNQGKTVVTYSYQLIDRVKNSANRKGFDASDAIYLLMPDRFSNGDPANDNLEGMLEKADRNNPNGRHGGDFTGISNHLDYIKNLGITAIWLNPVLENNQDIYSYHGYSSTNYYKVDPRFGSNTDYVNLCKAIHAKGMKVIMDMVFNHCGSGHWWMNDLPMADWLNQFPEFTQTSHRASTVSDPHVSGYDADKYVR